MEELFKEPSNIIAAIAALIGIASLLVSFFSAKSTKKYAKEQFELAMKQFKISITPEIEIKVFLQRKHPRSSENSSMGLFCEATNHSTTITINKLKVFLTNDGLGDCKGFGFIFPTWNDLKPGQTNKVLSFGDCEKIIPNSFPADTVDYFDIVDKTSFLLENEEYEKYPASLSIEFLPRIAGASIIKKQEVMYLLVMRKKP